MNNVILLDRTRKIGKLLHNNSTGKVVFSDICMVLAEILKSNIYIISRKGKVLGIGHGGDVPVLGELIEENIGDFIDSALNERLLAVLSTKENVSLMTLGFEREENAERHATISPIEIAGERLGTVFMYRSGAEYDIDDIILCEYGTTVVSLEMLRAVTEENEEENRRIAVVKSAIGTLSYSEMEAIVCIFDELSGKEGILVASKIADKEGITRSVIVNALRKFESAGVLESRSSGMKGTYIKVLNDAVYSEIDSIRKQIRAH
ncbi:GTP-sensing pleiotropic transcriptional regulator CodY [Lachnoclostridium sp. Marseille-P6806]|uniref:GTP-sensing pleiotropic transcriptional regulator CodY n=1 Tax=Lachnoclostridium sp. Marseille-P6806 TaxID=2364793 RepID=UPI0010304B13|nr:GTP-sensing pleiotropic transcriptional regulator CodY [Lachnoclostridium sp. Marseille-P6806]